MKRQGKEHAYEVWQEGILIFNLYLELSYQESTFLLIKIKSEQSSDLIE